MIFGLGIDVSPFEKLEKELVSNMDQKGNPAYNLALKINPGKGKVNTLFNPLEISAIYLAEKLGLAAFQKTTLKIREIRGFIYFNAFNLPYLWLQTGL